MVSVKKKTKKRLAQGLAIIMCVMMLVPLITYFLPNNSVSESQQVIVEEPDEAKKEEPEISAEWADNVLEGLKGPYEVVGVDTGSRLHIAVDQDRFIYVDLLGVKAPELFKAKSEEEEKAGNQAYEHARMLIEGHTVYLDYDKEIGSDTEEIQALVYLDDGTLLNEKMLEGGFAKASSPLPDELKEQFQAAQNRAKDSEAGLWGNFWKKK